MIKENDIYDSLLFVVEDSGGHIFKIYLNGMVEGFGKGAKITNYAAPLFDAILSKLSDRPNIKAASRTGNEFQSVT
jgi:hypothetical protein